MPGPMTASSGLFWVPAVAEATVNIEGGSGLELADMNGDSLVDLLWAIFDSGANPKEYFQCIYLNTGCGWGKCRILSSRQHS